MFFRRLNHLSKRLKRRILEICGLTDLKREDRALKAAEILADYEYKQSICHRIVGASHRDVEKVLKSIVESVQLSEEQIDYKELEQDHPEKFNPELNVRQSRKIRLVPINTGYEVAKLINASAEKLLDKPVHRPEEYESYSLEETQKLIKGDK